MAEQEKPKKTNYWVKYDHLDQHELYDLGVKQMSAQGDIDPDVYWEMDERLKNDPNNASAEFYLSEWNEAYKRRTGHDNPDWNQGASDYGGTTPGSVPVDPKEERERLRAEAMGNTNQFTPPGPTPSYIDQASAAMRGTNVAGPPSGGNTTYGIPDTGGQQQVARPGARGFGTSYGITDEGQPYTPDSALGGAVTGGQTGLEGPSSPYGPNSPLMGGEHDPYGLREMLAGSADSAVKQYMYGADSYLTKGNVTPDSLASGGWFDPTDPNGMNQLALLYGEQQGMPKYMSDEATPFLGSMDTLKMYEDPNYQYSSPDQLAEYVPERMDNLQKPQTLDIGHYYDLIMGGEYISEDPSADLSPEAQGFAVTTGIDALRPWLTETGYTALSQAVNQAYNTWRTGIETGDKTHPYFTDYLREIGADEWM